MGIERLAEKCRVTVSDDSMNATLFLEPPADGIAYGVDELSDFLKAKGVYSGINYTSLETMTQNNIYYRDYEVAEGKLPTEGTPGYFDLFFETNKNKKPVIRSDGSVDYQSMNLIESVAKGEKLAQYHPAVQGEHGYDVRGRQLRAKPCKDLPKLKGKGFFYDEDTYLYTSSTEGRITYENGKLEISDVYEHRGDLDLITGKIDFRGDVIIHGSVLAGTYVRASKSITIEGNVEAATLIAEGDIVLKKGMQGGKKAKIKCGGNVFASFIEFTEIEARGNIEANIIMNCKISCGNNITIAGKKGAIVGGETYAVGKIATNNVGNIAELKTVAAVGITKELTEREHMLNVKKMATKKNLENTDLEITKLNDSRLSNERSEVKKAKLSQLKRRRKRDERMIAHIDTEMEKIAATMTIGANAEIDVANTIFASSVVMIDDKKLEITNEQKSVKYVKNRLSGDIEIKASTNGK